MCCDTVNVCVNVRRFLPGRTPLGFAPIFKPWREARRPSPLFFFPLVRLKVILSLVVSRHRTKMRLPKCSKNVYTNIASCHDAMCKYFKKKHELYWLLRKKNLTLSYSMHQLLA